MLPTTITFPSQTYVQEAVIPHTEQNIIEASSLKFQYDPNVKIKNVIPIRNPGVGNLLKHKVFKDKFLTVYYPETPRFPHHLTIALNRDVKGITDVTEEENQALFKTLKTIAEIYRSVQIQDFVVAQFDTPQKGHQKHFVVEVIPHPPGFQKIKNIVDKVECNRYVLFRHENLTPITYPIDPKSINAHSDFWKKSFIQPTKPLQEEEITVTLPTRRYQSHHKEATEILKRHLMEFLQDKGGQISIPTNLLSIPIKVPENPDEKVISKCFFCEPNVLTKQRVYATKTLEILYNIRKGATPGCAFLILPKRHVQKVYGLTPEEINEIRLVRQALAAVLKEKHSGFEVVTYIQDGPSVGQTVLHSHEQVVAIDPKTVALSWTLMSLSSSDVSEEEMIQITQEIGEKIVQKLHQLEEAM